MSTADADRLADRPLVFVGGLHRSGTSLVAGCLGAHPRVSALSRTGVPEDEGQHLQDVYPTAAMLGGPGLFAFAPAAHLDETSALATASSRDRLVRAWEPYWDLDRPTLLEKSPPNLLRTRFLQALFPQASFVMVVRHPGVVALATRAWRPDQPLVALLRHWFCAHAILRADAADIRRIAVVPYEAAVARPRAVFDALARWLGLGSGVPIATVDPARAETYRHRWQGAEALEAARHFEAAANRYGYSFADLLRWTPSPETCTSVLASADRTSSVSSADGGTPNSRSIERWNRS